jgi:hypothetical protein
LESIKKLPKYMPMKPLKLEEHVLAGISLVINLKEFFLKRVMKHEIFSELLKQQINKLNY